MENLHLWGGSVAAAALAGIELASADPLFRQHDSSELKTMSQRYFPTLFDDLKLRH